MKIVVIGGTGLIGSKTVAILREEGGRVEERSLVPLGEARLGHIGLDEWLRRSKA
jgi:nucleoside-diphosphate-sugar epimerase